MQTIKIPDNIWERGLSPSTFRVYCGLLSVQQNGCVRVSIRALAAAVFDSHISVAQGLQELQDKAVIRIETGQDENCYILLQLQDSSYSCTPLPISLLSPDFLATELMIYTFLLASANGADTVSKSLSQIAQATGLSASTVFKRLRELVRRGLIGKEESLNPDGSHNNNSYSFPMLLE